MARIAISYVYKDTKHVIDKIVGGAKYFTRLAYFFIDNVSTSPSRKKFSFNSKLPFELESNVSYSDAIKGRKANYK